MATRTQASASITYDQFATRHIGPSASEQQAMLQTLGYETLDAFIDAVVPEAIRFRRELQTGSAMTEPDVLASLRTMANRNALYRSWIGMGYYGTHTPGVILRNVMENPAWYTAYTPYQAEIAQGRLEALLNFQTVVVDLTGLPIANASLLDEGTAAAEAMALALHAKGTTTRKVFLVAADCHPQTIAVVRARAAARGVTVRVEAPSAMQPASDVFGLLLQYPATDGAVADYRALTEAAHAAGALVTVATDLLALCLLTPPGEWGADMAVGSAQRFGVPMGFGGPHAAFFATRDEFKRLLPGRIIGISRDADGHPALRMALQTREQHIRREKATSNVCTAQVLLAVMAGMYAVYHGPDGLRQIAERVHTLTATLAAGLKRLGFALSHEDYFDTVRIEVGAHGERDVLREADARRINLRVLEPGTITISLDETATPHDVETLWQTFNGGAVTFAFDDVLGDVDARYDERFRRVTPYLQNAVFHAHHSETEMLRYLQGLEARDFSLVHGMIPLGSCTMKLNATAEMIPVTWPEFGQLHPFAPARQTAGYTQLFEALSRDLAEITGFAGVSLQPNAGSQGEYAGLLVIRAYHASRGEAHRTVCLIPQSAHGTNPASAVMAGFEVVVVRTDEQGNIDVDDLRAKAEQHATALGALMVTYPSTHGVFESRIREITAIVHEHGGQVYMDGANMNAMVGISRPGDLGADVCHLNLHKTFCIPHGGGGPGMGPIGVAAQLVPFLPTHPVIATGGVQAIGPVSAAPFGSASILPISYVYIRLMGGAGLTLATKVAILSANYVAKRLEGHYDVLYRGQNGLVAHECILDTRPLKAAAGVEVEDIAKRLMDYGFHAPTMSFPVAGPMMVEPTESESKAELDRFVDAMIGIRDEIAAVERGESDRTHNVLSHAPHTMRQVVSDVWTRPYSREQAAFPSAHTRQHKFWPHVARIESAYGDRNLVCACPPLEEYVS
jgi:glycine dehydrogenase